MRKHMALLLACLLFLCSYAQAGTVTHYYGDRESSRIAITVDDCYSQEHMESILDLCEEYDIPVTFFLIGSAIRSDWKSTYERAIALGCELGNHTYGHASLTKLSDSLIQKQLLDTEKSLDSVLGYHYEMKVMRPPYGNVEKDGKTIVRSVRAAGYETIALWDVSQTDPAKCIRKVQNGSILLFHTIAKDVRCLEVLIPDLLNSGFVPVTVSQLLHGDEEDSAQVSVITVTAPPAPVESSSPSATVSPNVPAAAAEPTVTPAPTAEPTPVPTPTATPRVIRVTVQKSSSR